MRRKVALAVVLGALACVVAGQVVVAQQAAGGGRQQFIDRYIDRLKTDLALTDEQVTAIKALWQEKMAAAGDDRAARRTAMTEIQSGIRALLDPEQQKKFDARRQGGAREATVASTITRLDAALGRLELNEATRQRLAAMRADRDKQIQAALNAYRDRVMPLLTPEQQEALKKSLAARVRPQGRRGRTGTGTPGASSTN